MSFSNEIKIESIAIQTKKTCCRKAFALGLFMGAREVEGEKLFVSTYTEEALAEAAAETLGKIFRVSAECFKQNIAGRITYGVKYFSPAIADFLKAIDKGDSRMIHDIAGFRCETCVHAFLRGSFVACGSVSDPTKTYHAELIFPTQRRADVVAELLRTRSGPVKNIKRGDRYGIYYKSNNSIADMLYYMGCSKAGLLVSDMWIEHDIRNLENRATNCVASNISKSVSASQRQINAIEKLTESGGIEKLPEELRYTARLRVENDSATLSELAMMHTPPITKSGLNGRLRKIVEAAEDLEK